MIDTPWKTASTTPPDALATQPERCHMLRGSVVHGLPRQPARASTATSPRPRNRHRIPRPAWPPTSSRPPPLADPRARRNEPATSPGGDISREAGNTHITSRRPLRTPHKPRPLQPHATAMGHGATPLPPATTCAATLPRPQRSPMGSGETMPPPLSPFFCSAEAVLSMLCTVKRTEEPW